MSMRHVGFDPSSKLPVFENDQDGVQWLQTGNGHWQKYREPQAPPPPQWPQHQPGSRGFEPPPPQPGSSAMMVSPQHRDLAQAATNNGDQLYRRPFYPTAPIYYPGAGKVTRSYAVQVLSTDTDNVVGSAIPRTITFPQPVVLVARNGAAFSSAAGNAFPVGLGPRDVFLVKMTIGQTSEAIDTLAVLASTVLGTGERPGEIGGDGWVIDAGNTLTIEITPLVADMRISVALIVLEQRGRANFVPPGQG
jgi:hypothetical protein